MNYILTDNVEKLREMSKNEIISEVMPFEMFEGIDPRILFESDLNLLAFAIINFANKCIVYLVSECFPVSAKNFYLLFLYGDLSNPTIKSIIYNFDPHDLDKELLFSVVSDIPTRMNIFCMKFAEHIVKSDNVKLYIENMTINGFLEIIKSYFKSSSYSNLFTVSFVSEIAKPNYVYKHPFDLFCILLECVEIMKKVIYIERQNSDEYCQNTFYDLIDMYEATKKALIRIITSIKPINNDIFMEYITNNGIRYKRRFYPYSTYEEKHQDIEDAVNERI